MMVKKTDKRQYLTAPVDHGPVVDSGPKSERGELYRERHGGVDFIETMTAGVRAAKVREECTLDRYYQRMQLVDRHHIAGCRLRSLWMRAAYPQATTSSYGEQRGQGGGDGASDARSALRRILLDTGLGTQALEQPVLVISSSGQKHWPVVLPVSLTSIGHVVIGVCGLDEWAGGTRRLDMLREGLTLLADHWEIPSDADSRSDAPVPA